jgi:hypothetical protein
MDTHENSALDRFPPARGVGPADEAIRAAYIAEGCCPHCAPHAALVEGSCPTCHHPLGRCERCGAGWWATGAGGTGQWGMAAPEIEVDDDEVAAWITERTRIDLGVVAAVLDSEMDFLRAAGIAG